MKPIWSGALLFLLMLGVGLSTISCGGDDSNPVVPPGGGADLTIDIIADMGAGAFGAAPETVLVNETVSWRNTRGTTHTSTSMGGPAGGQWNTGNIGAGATSAPITMDTPGSYPYECTIHIGMTGGLVVLP